MGKPAPLPVAATSLPRVHVGIGGADANQINSLNGVSSLPYPGPFLNNRPLPSPAVFQNGQILFGNPVTVPLPPAANRATAPAEGFAEMRITVDGRETVVPLVPGHFANAEEFAEANRRNFETAMPRGFDIEADGDRLVVTTRVYTGGVHPSVSFVINPTRVQEELGFLNTLISDISSAFDEAGGLIIQSGANEGDINIIQMPRLCTRSLGLSIRRPEDERVFPDGFEHINGRGPLGYVTVANVAGDPMEYSLDVRSHENASAAITVLSNAINIVSMERAQIGAQQNRLEFTRQNVDNTSENLQAAESRIRDTDMAAEMTTLVKNQILQQSSTAMLAQANALPQGVLQLLG